MMQSSFLISKCLHLFLVHYGCVLNIMQSSKSKSNNFYCTEKKSLKFARQNLDKIKGLQ